MKRFAKSLLSNNLSHRPTAQSLSPNTARSARSDEPQRLLKCELAVWPAYFAELGFQVATGPDIETEYYNFDSLNTPADHPARDSHDTFFVKPGVVLRTHTSPVQMRVMQQNQLSFCIILLSNS